MKLPKPADETARRFDALAGGFVERGATRGQMFGMPMLKVGGRVFVNAT